MHQRQQLVTIIFGTFLASGCVSACTLLDYLSGREYYLPTSSAGGIGGIGGAGGAADAETGGEGGTINGVGGMGGMLGAGGTGGSGGIVPDTIINQLTKGTIVPGTPVILKSVVVMSHKFLAAQSKTSGSCLWSVFVSDINLNESKEYSGISIRSYGARASIPDGSTEPRCPRLGIDTTGDAIPDNIAPGDVIDVYGEANYFRHPSCKDTNNAAPQRHVWRVWKVVDTNIDMPIPKSKEFDPNALSLFGNASSGEFHDKWGGVKIRITNVTTIPQTVSLGLENSTDLLGNMTIRATNNPNPAPGSTLIVGDLIYYRNYLQDINFCHAPPCFAQPETSLAAVEGFYYLNKCDWTLQVNSKCGGLTPPSDDCNGNAADCP